MKPQSLAHILLALFVVTILFTGPVYAQSGEVAEGIASKIEVVSKEIQKTEPVEIRFTLANTTDKQINVLKWNTPIEGFNANIFLVTRDGEPVTYIGRVVKRGAPRPEDYVSIAPGEAVSAVVDLSQAYEIYEMGEYNVEFKSILFDIGHDTAAKLAEKTVLTPKAIQSNAVSFRLSEKREGPALKPLLTKEQIEAKAPVFKNCSQAQQNTINSADGNARSFSDSSYATLTGTPVDKRPSCERYTYWFGTYDGTRYDTVTSHFLKIRNAFADQTVTYNCGCNEDYYAYVYPNNPYEIFLCNTFWTAPATGTDSQFGTLVHEMSHFYVTANTTDHVYGQTGAHNLATTNPANAITNADNHEYYSENTPVRQCDSGASVGVGAIWRYTGTPCSGNSCPGWQLFDNNAATVRIAAGGNNLYQLHNSGKIWKSTGAACSGSSCPGWQMLDNNPATIGIAADETQLYQLHNSGKIWKFTGTACSGNSCPGWQMLDNNPATIAIIADGGQLYQLHNTGKIWRYTGTACSGNSCPGWQMLDNNTATFSIAAGGGKLYQLHNSGKIWKFTGTACSGNSCPGWQMLDNNPATIAIVAGSQLYQLHNTGKIWKSTGAACSGNSCPGWQMLDNNPATIGIYAETTQLYQLHNTGKIWKSTGAACSGNSCPGWQMLDNNTKTGRIAASGGKLYQLHLARTPMARTRTCYECK